VFPLKLEIPPLVRTTILQKYLELRVLEFHRRNSCGRRPGFRRRPRKPSTAKPGWRSISTLYLTARFSSVRWVWFYPRERTFLTVNFAYRESFLFRNPARAPLESRRNERNRRRRRRKFAVNRSVFKPPPSVFATNYMVEVIVVEKPAEHGGNSSLKR